MVWEYVEALLQPQYAEAQIGAPMLCSPYNPLGMQYKCIMHSLAKLSLLSDRYYPRKSLIALMKLCQRYQIHFISDKVFLPFGLGRSEVSWCGQVHLFPVYRLDKYYQPDIARCSLGNEQGESLSRKGQVLNPYVFSLRTDFVEWNCSVNGLRLGCVISQSNNCKFVHRI